MTVPRSIRRIAPVMIALVVVLIAEDGRAQCITPYINDTAEGVDSCTGMGPFERRDSWKQYQVQTSVSCNQGGFYGTAFPSSSPTVYAYGECGNNTSGAPQCFGEVGPGSPHSYVGSEQYRFDVGVVSGFWNGTDCSSSYPGATSVYAYAENCDGTTCCSGAAEEACNHLGGNWGSCFCYLTPIIVNLDGDEIDLTDADGGVLFDLLPDGNKEPVAWTRLGRADAFLVLDRNGNGLIDNGRELFGNATIQPPTDQRNGFKALAMFDVNDDQVLDERDPTFAKLQLWIDANHNGQSEPSELQSVSAAAVQAIGLKYEATDRVDPHGNAFKYKATITVKRGDGVVQLQMWDVVLVASPTMKR